MEFLVARYRLDTLILRDERITAEEEEGVNVKRDFGTRPCERHNGAFARGVGVVPSGAIWVQRHANRPFD